MDGAVVGGIAASLFLALLLRRARADPPPTAGPDGPLVLRHSRPVLILGVVCSVGVPAVITALAVFVSPPRPDERGAVAALYALFIGLGAPLLWEAARFELRVGPAGIDHRSAWLGRASVPWADVRQVTYSRANGWFVIRTVSGRARRVSVMLPGVSGFLAACEQRLLPAALAGARAGYQHLGRPFPG